MNYIRRAAYLILIVAACNRSAAMVIYDDQLPVKDARVREELAAAVQSLRDHPTDVKALEVIVAPGCEICYGGDSRIATFAWLRASLRWQPCVPTQQMEPEPWAFRPLAHGLRRSRRRIRNSVERKQLETINRAAETFTTVPWVLHSPYSTRSSTTA